MPITFRSNNSHPYTYIHKVYYYESLIKFDAGLRKQGK